VLGCILFLFAICHVFGKTSKSATDTVLSGSSWGLVSFHSADDKTLKVNDRSNYTITFAPSGHVSVRIGCTLGRAVWKGSTPNQLHGGALSLTRVLCPSAALNRRIMNDWQSVRSYTIEDAQLVLSLTDSRGNYEFEPSVASKVDLPKSPVRSRAGPSNSSVRRLAATTCSEQHTTRPGRGYCWWSVEARLAQRSAYRAAAA
jgi:heat shock protein HslJ